MCYGMVDNFISTIRNNGFKKTTTQKNDGCNHTSINAPDPIKTLQLSMLGQE